MSGYPGNQQTYSTNVVPQTQYVVTQPYVVSQPYGQSYVQPMGAPQYVVSQPYVTNQSYQTNSYPGATSSYQTQEGIVVTAPPQPTTVQVVQTRTRNGCYQCGTLYPLPSGATSWRCKQCGAFNDLQPTGLFCCCCLPWGW